MTEEIALPQAIARAADLIDGVAGPGGARLRAMLTVARVHSPLFTLRGGTNEVLRGIVARGARTT